MCQPLAHEVIHSLTMNLGHPNQCVLFIATSALCAAALTASARSESFDRPTRTIKLNLGRSKYLLKGSPSHATLQCFYYQNFMIKDLNDPGLKGAWTTIVPVTQGTFPRCSRAKADGERSFNSDSTGDFLGVKGELVFLGSADADGFAAFDAKTCQNVFHDTAEMYASGWKLEFDRSRNGEMVLLYDRAFEGDCSIPDTGEVCWTKFKEQTRIRFPTVPQCSGYTEAGAKERSVCHRVPGRSYPFLEASHFATAGTANMPRGRVT